ncbi:hypothetical protein TNCV_4599391 [Trichonephila clavipes]|nr:hypothetical protein TNCV_4599391 [Trichonephila clavipes]
MCNYSPTNRDFIDIKGPRRNFDTDLTQNYLRQWYLLTSYSKVKHGRLATNLIILNHVQETKTTTELTPLLLTSTPGQFACRSDARTQDTPATSP